MRASLLIVIFLIGLISQALAQNPSRIRGRITSAPEKGSEPTGATVLLLRAKDSTSLKTTLAAKDGTFSFEGLAADTYLIAVTAVGYQKAFSGPVRITAENPTATLPAMQLLPLAKSMAGVTVTAQKPLIEQKVDRTVMNVDASVTNVGATALEVLEKAPGITIDKDGNISLKGKEGVLVLIDGRPTQLSGADLANMLRSMSANQMDQVEIMTTPPARYDAAGNAGILNIKTKKKVSAGYNGSFTLTYTQGQYAKTSEGLNFNIREGKVAVFSNLNHNYRKNFEVLAIQRRLRHPASGDIQNYFEQEGKRVVDGNSYSAKVGLDFYASKKTTLGVVFNGYHSPSAALNRNVTNISTSAKELQSVTKATVDNSSTWQNFSTNLNFRRTLNGAGRELTADLDYMIYDSRSELFMVNAYFDAAGAPFRKADSLEGILPQNIAIYSGRVDYIHPLKKDARFEAGVKSTVVRTDNNVGYDSIQYGRVVHDGGRSNHFVYEEAINAAYVNLSAPLSKKLSAQLGLRLEHTTTQGNQLTTGQKFDRDYAQLFPTAYLQYKANAKHNFAVNYGRRLRRPNYESLNPFIRFIDRYTYSLGNPELKPQFSHNIELSHTYQNFLTTTLNYTAANNLIQNVIEQKGEEAYSKPANIASQRQYGLSVNANKSLNKWWTINLYMNLFNNRFSGLVNTDHISFSATTFSMNGSQQFKLSKTGTAELSGGYRSPGVQGVIQMKSRRFVTVGYSQQVLKSKGTLRLTVRDIFYQQKGRASTRYGNVDANFQERADSRVVTLGFTYRFSKGKVNGPRKRQGSDEEARVGMD
jgi:iron complex outermembrane recepter protein